MVLQIHFNKSRNINSWLRNLELDLQLVDQKGPIKSPSLFCMSVCSSVLSSAFIEIGSLFFYSLEEVRGSEVKK